MDKPGTHNMQQGVFWLGIGTALTIGSYVLFQGAGGVLFYGAILVGGIQFVAGAFQRVRYETLRPEEKQRAHADATLITLLRCMAMIASADGDVSNEEIETMASICRKLTGAPIYSDDVRAIVDKVGTGGSDPVDFVASKGTQVPLRARITIAQACYMIMRADGEIQPQEEKLFARILEGLQLPREQVMAKFAPVAR